MSSVSTLMKRRRAGGVPAKSLGDSGREYRPGKTGFCQRLVDKYKKWYFGPDLAARSRYATKRRTMPPLAFRNVLHNNFKTVSSIGVAKEHSHPEAASLRTSVAAALENVILAAGYTPYSVSMSGRDRYDGCRYVYMPKDLDKEFKDCPVRDDHVIIMIDVDYYCDINRWLEFGNPLMIYTFVPTEAAGQSLNARYSIKDDVVTYIVEGGVTYEHELWDYRGDMATVRDRYGNLLVYSIEQYILDADPTRRVIGFYPIATFPPNTCPIKCDTTGVRRLKCCNAGVVCLKDVSKATVSVAVEGSSTSVTVPQAVFDALLIRRGVSKNPVISDVERILNHAHIADAATKAPVLFKLLSDPVVSGCIVQTSTIPVHNFQTVYPLATEDGKSVGRAVAPSLVTAPAVIPAKSYNNDHATVAGRITAVRNTKTTPPAWATYDRELTNYIVPNPGCGTPLELEQIIEIQDRPAQRGRSEQIKAALCQDNINKVKAFIKAEAYGSVTDPRNISTVDPGHQLNYSRYTYAFKEDCLKGRPWFASSMNPTEITERVYELAQHPDGQILSDYSRLDGHVSADDKRFKENVYIYWCHPEHRAHLQRVLRADRTAKGTTAQGVKYDTGTSQLSGSPGTTNDNNLVTLRHDYIALRELGMSEAKALEFLETWVLGASDDRMRANIPGYAEMLETVARTLGHKLVSQVFYPLDDDPIPFLGRIYMPGYYKDSIQDPIRTLPKLHLTVAPNDVPDEVALLNRATGYYVTDSKTPIIGPWCRKVIELLTMQGVKVKMLMKSDRLRIEGGPYTQDNPELLRDLMCRFLELTPDELDNIEMKIAIATNISELPEFVLDNIGNVVHKIPAVVGHDIVGPVPAVSKDAKPDTTDIPECHSATTISVTYAHPETSGLQGSNPICANRSQPQTTAATILVHTADTTGPLTKQKSRRTSRASFRPSNVGVSEHQTVTQRPNPRPPRTPRQTSRPPRQPPQQQERVLLSRNRRRKRKNRNNYDAPTN